MDVIKIEILQEDSVAFHKISVIRNELFRLFSENGFKVEKRAWTPHITIAKISLLPKKTPKFPPAVCQTDSEKNYFLHVPITLSTLDLLRIGGSKIDSDGYYHTEESRSRTFNIVNS